MNRPKKTVKDPQMSRFFWPPLFARGRWGGGQQKGASAT